MPSAPNFDALDTDETITVAGAALAALNGRFENESDLPSDAFEALGRACDEFDTAVQLWRGATEDARYTVLNSYAANEQNRIGEVMSASGLNVCALVDEKQGGIVGYIVSQEAPALLRRLNA